MVRSCASRFSCRNAEARRRLSAHGRAELRKTELQSLKMGRCYVHESGETNMSNLSGNCSSENTGEESQARGRTASLYGASLWGVLQSYTNV